MLSPHKQPSTALPGFKAIYARGLTSQAVNLTHTPHWPECLMYYEGNACSDRNLCNWQVNALKAGERLTFDKAGVTIVYGDNGSGKSGYARILKKICRARTSSSENQILPNIYETTVRPQSAVIDYMASGHNMSEFWTAEEVGDSLLSTVSVFDRQTANVHVDETNEVAYTLFPMRILEYLASGCQLVKKYITEEISRLDQKTPAAIVTPACRPSTVVGRLVAGLSGATKEQDVRTLAKVNSNEIARFETLKVGLGRDPKRDRPPSRGDKK